MNNIITLPNYQVERVISTLSENIDWSQSKYQIPKTWTITEGQDITILVLDTGCPTHKDLDGAILVDKCKSFCKDEPDIFDKNGHSTFVCSVIAARRNDYGVIGVAPKSNIITYKVLGQGGSGEMNNILEALTAAKELKPDIINMSLGSPFGDDRLEKIINELTEMGIPIVCAAGNSGNESGLDYPADYKNTISVASININDKLSSFSSFGPDVTIVAPGENMYFCYLNNTYAKLSGTSFSSPYVAAVTGLMISKHHKQVLNGGTNDCVTVDQIKEHFKKYSINRTFRVYDMDVEVDVIDPYGMLMEEELTVEIKPMKLTLWQTIKQFFGISVLLISLIILNSGCLTAYNHDRIKQNMIKERISATGTPEMKAAMAQGVKPSKIFSLIPVSDGKGLMVAFNITAMADSTGFWNTFKESPVSSSFSILGDSILTGAAYMAIKNNVDTGSDTKEDININITDSKNVNVYMNSDGNNSTITETKTEK